MTAPVETYVQLPDDAANTGKKVRTQSRVVGANTVAAHHFIPTSIQLIKSVYMSASALYTVANSVQNGTTAAVFWLQVPTSATINARVRRFDVAMTNNVNAVVDMATAPRFAFARFTHTGSWSGALQTAVKRKTTDATNQATIVTASTGATVTLVATLWAALVPGMDVTSSGIYNSFLFQYWYPTTEDEFIDLAPGEGLVAYQLDAATVSDQRKLAVNIVWDEYDNQ